MRLTLCLLVASSTALAATALRAEPGEIDVATLGTAVALDSLDSQRGGQAVQIDGVYMQSSTQTVGANLNGNALRAGVNGANSVGEGVFSGASGVTTLIQNSGNQVIIQNSTIINLQLN